MDLWHRIYFAIGQHIGRTSQVCRAFFLSSLPLLLAPHSSQGILGMLHGEQALHSVASRWTRHECYFGMNGLTMMLQCGKAASWWRKRRLSRLLWVALHLSRFVLFMGGIFGVCRTFFFKSNTAGNTLNIFLFQVSTCTIHWDLKYSSWRGSLPQMWEGT